MEMQFDIIPMADQQLRGLYAKYNSRALHEDNAYLLAKFKVSGKLFPDFWDRVLLFPITEINKIAAKGSQYFQAYC